MTDSKNRNSNWWAPATLMGVAGSVDLSKETGLIFIVPVADSNSVVPPVTTISDTGRSRCKGPSERKAAETNPSLAKISRPMEQLYSGAPTSVWSQVPWALPFKFP